MTSIILLMWLADIANSINAICTLLLIVGFMGLPLSVIVGGIEDEMGAVLSFWRKCAPWLAIPLVIGLVTPSKGTVQLIALVSAVEVAAETDLGKKAAVALTEVLDKIKKDASESK